MLSIATLGITSNAIIQHSTVSTGIIGTCLKVKELSDGVWLKDHGHVKINLLAQQTQAHEFSHAQKGKCSDKQLNFIVSPEVRFSLAVTT
jgi:hypothetical protein